jgi:hypothetical protein
LLLPVSCSSPVLPRRRSIDLLLPLMPFSGYFTSSISPEHAQDMKLRPGAKEIWP